MKSLGRPLPYIAAPGDQQSRHDSNTDCRAGKMPASPTAKMAVLLRGRDFNLFEDILLYGADLFETNQFQKCEKSYHYFQPRHGSSKQIRKTEGSARRHPLQNRIDLFRNTKTLAKNFLYVLSRFDSLDDCLEGIDELKNSNFAQAQWFLQRYRRRAF